MPEHDIPRRKSLLVPVPAGAVSGPLFPGDQVVIGWSFKETTGAAPAEVWLVDGNDATGNPFAFLTLSAGQSRSDEVAGPGLCLTTGLALKVISGSVQGCVWTVDA